MPFEKPPVVIDNGSFEVKAGFSCDNHPISMFRNVVGRPKYLKGSYGRENYDLYVGDDALDYRESLDLCFSVDNGQICNWDNMERIWHHIFYRELKAAPDDRPVMLGVATSTTLKDKLKLCEIFFETLNCPTLCMQPQSVLALYGYGVTTGVSINIGFDNANINPVYEGGPIMYAQIQTNFGGHQISDYIKKQLIEKNVYFGTKNNEVIIEEIKRSCLYVTLDSAMSQRDCCEMFKLPDGNEINITQEAFMAAEMIFQPDLVCNNDNYIPLHNAVVTSVLKCDPELRAELYESVYLSGGTSMIPGIGPRLTAEVENIKNSPVTVSTSSEGYAVSWLGGAVFSSLPETQQLWVTKKKFDDYGQKIIKNKFC